MSRGPEITNEVRLLIAEIINEDPERTAKEVTQQVQAKLRQLNLQARPNWPGLTTVQNILAKIREKKLSQAPLGLDSPWSLGRLAEYNIPSEALPKVLEIQELKSGHAPLTIREAVWVGRLHSIIDDTTELAVWAALYAGREMIVDQAGLSKDTNDIDSSFRSKLITYYVYFPWMFNQEWIPESFKIKVSEIQTSKYEKLWGFDLDRPNFTIKGWEVYTRTLQASVIWNVEQLKLPEKLRLLNLLSMRLTARNEGRILSSKGKYLDLFETMKTGEYCEKSGKSKELLKIGGNVLKEFREITGHEFTERVPDDMPEWAKGCGTSTLRSNEEIAEGKDRVQGGRNERAHSKEVQK